MQMKKRDVSTRVCLSGDLQLQSNDGAKPQAKQVVKVPIVKFILFHVRLFLSTKYHVTLFLEVENSWTVDGQSSIQ